MTGISDVARSARFVKRSFSDLILICLLRCIAVLPIPQSWLELAVLYWSPTNGNDVTCIGSMPKPLLGYFQEGSVASQLHEDKFLREDKLPSEDNISRGKESHQWGLLLPVCCRTSSEQESSYRLLADFVDSLDHTVGGIEERSQLHIIIGIDQYDLLYDRDDTRQRIEQLFRSISIDKVSFVILRSHYRGKLCKIWDHLAGVAIEKGCELFVLLGDDIRFQSSNWKMEIEAQFKCISECRGLPFGIGCVAFRDTAFKVFPTFPVIHRVHMEVFGSLFPIEFVNQHGDPYLFEIYRRWGASEFSSTATLENTIGGAGTARYSKHNIHWRGDVLTRALVTLADYLARTGVKKVTPFRCLNVVVPSFRCDVSMLRAVTELQATVYTNASVHFMIVVDNPASPHLAAVRALEDWSPNHLVRIYENATNLGASLSRNTGMASSFGDHTVLLDDDVIPDPGLLDAYLGAISRHPEAKVLVGLTKLPRPQTLIQRALIASQMTFFFDVAARMKNPPWGITANLCVEGRTNNEIWFSDKYPKTGGGEDVDYCLRVKDMQAPHARNAAIVSVPEAKVQHPFWDNVSKQVVGWARGDVLCLSELPQHAFYTLPNWIEFIVVGVLLSILCAPHLYNPQPDDIKLWSYWMCKTAVLVIMAEITLNSFVAFPHTSKTTAGIVTRITVSMLASLPAMMQDMVRLQSKIRQGKFHQICFQFDWLDGQREHVSASVFGARFKFFVFLILSGMAATVTGWVMVLYSCVLLGAGILWCQGQDFSPDVEVDHVIQRLPPLPIDFKGSPGAPFVILAWQRTGSNLLCGKLHNHFQVVMHNEIFNDAKIWTYQNEDIKSDPTWTWDVGSRDADPVAFMDDLYHREPLKKKLTWRAVGFKLFPDHWRSENEEALQQLLADKRVKKIILRRDNYLDVYASKLRADKTGHYIRKPLDNVSLHIDLASFEKFVAHYDACYAYYDRLVQGQEVCRVSYDELVGREGEGQEREAAQTMARVLTFLGVDNTVLPEPLDVTVKQSRRPLKDGVLNYHEVNQAFAAHPLVSKWL